MAEKFGTRQIAHPLDAPELPVPVDDTVEHGDTVAVGRRAAGGRSTCAATRPARSPWCTARPTARTCSPATRCSPAVRARPASPADFASLMDDLEERVFGALPDETWVYPGHGDDTTLGTERPQLPEWRERGW